MNAIDLSETYQLVSIWRIDKRGRWKLVDFGRQATAVNRCRQEQDWYCFLPSYCPRSYKGGDNEPLLHQEPRQAVSHHGKRG